MRQKPTAKYSSSSNGQQNEKNKSVKHLINLKCIATCCLEKHYNQISELSNKQKIFTEKLIKELKFKVIHERRESVPFLLRVWTGIIHPCFAGVFICFVK